MQLWKIFQRSLASDVAHRVSFPLPILCRGEFTPCDNDGIVCSARNRAQYVHLLVIRRQSIGFEQIDSVTVERWNLRHGTAIHLRSQPTTHFLHSKKRLFLCRSCNLHGFSSSVPRHHYDSIDELLPFLVGLCNMSLTKGALLASQ